MSQAKPVAYLPHARCYSGPERDPHQGPDLYPMHLAAAAIFALIGTLPCGTGYFIGVVLIVMMTGRLSQTKGSLARAAYPFVAQLYWGWHRVERALERGRLNLDTLVEQAYRWTIENLPVEPVCLGPLGREVTSIDTSTIARLRAGKKLAHAAKGYCHRAGRSIRSHVVAVATSVVFIAGVRVGLVRRTRLGASSEAAIEELWTHLPPAKGPRLIVVDAGIATKERFAAADEQNALMGRLRINAVLYKEPPPPTGKVGRPASHGPALHPGADHPELPADEEALVMGAQGYAWVRRWNGLHFREYPGTIVDVVRIDDPSFKEPLLIISTARELSLLEFIRGYEHRWPVETNFFVGQDTAAMEMPRAWTANAVERRISLALITSSLLKAIAASVPAMAIGPWDRKPERSSGRLAHFLDLNAMNFAALVLRRVPLRNYRKIQQPKSDNEFQELPAAVNW